MSDGFVEVYNPTTGVTSRTPRDWLDSPVLGRGLRLTPFQVALDIAAAGVDRPTEKTTKADLEEFATTFGIVLTPDVDDDDTEPVGDLSKADIWDTVFTVLTEGDEALAGSAAPPPVPPAVDASAISAGVTAQPYAEQYAAAQAQIAELTAQVADLEQRLPGAVREGARPGTSAGTRSGEKTTVDGTPAAGTSTTDTPAAGDKE